MRACAVVLCGVLALGCEGPRGPAGERGEQGERGGEGADGKNGKDGAKGDDGAMGARGLPGAPGPAGERGPRGPVGPAGSDADAGTERGYEPGLWVACSSALDLVAGGALGQDGITETSLSYRVTAFVGLDVDVQCEAGLGTVESASGSGYFPAVTTGAQTAGCLAAVDYPPAGSNAGFWKFAIVAGNGPRATYSDADSGHPLDGDFHAFTEDECNVLLNKGDGWTQSSLAAVFK